MTGPSLPLRLLRLQIGAIDRGMRCLLRLRQVAVGQVGQHKRRCGLPAEDPQREASMAEGAQRDGAALGLSTDAARELLEVTVRHCRPALRGDFSAHFPALFGPPPNWRRWLPPPSRLAPLLRRLPQASITVCSRQLFQAALAVPLANGELASICNRQLAIEAVDLGLRWVVRVEDRRIIVLPPSADAEATIRGSATDLLRLAARVEDADTLFFKRALQLTGDVELGLTARNLLDRMPWETVPLGLRIVLQRIARAVESAREAHREACAR